MMNSTKLSIVIVNFNTASYVAKCLASIYSKNFKFEFDVIVVDNNSPEKDIHSLVSEFPEARFLFLDTNKGFGAGCNSGAAESGSEYLLFLNPDAELVDDSIKYMIDFLDKNDHAGVCAGLLVDENKNVSYSFNSFPDLSWEFKQATGIRLMKTINALINNPNIAKNKPFEIDWAHGAFLMIRKNIYNKIGGFDEKIFLYYEDTDLQKRILLSGYKNFCIPSAKVMHHTQSSVKDEEVKVTYYYNMNLSKLYYLNKYMSFISIFFVRVFYVLGSLLRIFKLIFESLNLNSKANRLKEYFIVMKVYLFKFNVTDTHSR